MKITGSDSLYLNSAAGNASTASSEKLSSTISNLSSESSDEELLDACKSFEEYLVEQVVKSTKSALLENEEEEENDYLSTFPDTINQEYAKIISENANLGIAQMLYESIKNNGQ